MKKWIIILIVILALVVFFWPKHAGSHCGFCPGFPHVDRRESGCFGIPVDVPRFCMDCGPLLKCLGIPLNQEKCFTTLNGEYVKLPACDRPLTNEEIESLCPECTMENVQKELDNGNFEEAVEFCRGMVEWEPCFNYAKDYCREYDCLH